MQQPIIVWDFDGVLNANVVDRQFVWVDRLELDWGIDRAALVAHLFHPERIGRIMRGQSDLRDALQNWFAGAGHDIDAVAFMGYWFARDALPDAQIVNHLDRDGATHVIGTNNEPRRAAYIEDVMGFGDRVSHVFASGRMGHAKPDAAFFHHIEAWSGAPAQAHMLIDDTKANVEAALSLGWHGFHFSDVTRDGLPAFLDQLA